MGGLERRKGLGFSEVVVVVVVRLLLLLDIFPQALLMSSSETSIALPFPAVENIGIEDDDEDGGRAGAGVFMLLLLLLLLDIFDQALLMSSSETSIALPFPAVENIGIDDVVV